MDDNKECFEIPSFKKVNREQSQQCTNYFDLSVGINKNER